MTCIGYAAVPLDELPRQDHRSQRVLLVPFSGSPSARYALDAAADWSRRLDAEVWVLHVRVFVRGPGESGIFFFSTPVQSQDIANQAVQALRRRGIAASGMVQPAHRGSVAQTIVSVGDSLPACAIMLGTQSPRSASSMLNGSTTRSVLRRTHRPVIVIHYPRWLGRQVSPCGRTRWDGNR